MTERPAPLQSVPVDAATVRDLGSAGPVAREPLVPDRPPSPASADAADSTLVAAIRERALDEALAGLLWALVEARMPFVVAGPPGTGRERFRDLLLGLLPAATPVRRILSGDAGSIAPSGATEDAPMVLVTPDLATAESSTSALGPPETRAVLRAVAVGRGLAATMEADSLETALGLLGGPPVSLGNDELSLLGLVLILAPLAGPEAADVGETTSTQPGRVVAVHWMRPVVRDAHGHVQRLGPAVLGTWDERRGGWEHFAWGVMPELAMRIGRRPGALEVDVASRVDVLSRLLRVGADDSAVRAAIAGHRPPSTPS